MDNPPFMVCEELKHRGSEDSKRKKPQDFKLYIACCTVSIHAASFSFYGFFMFSFLELIELLGSL